MREAFPEGCEFWEVANDPHGGEAATLAPALRELRSTSGSEHTFYAHSKGASSWGAGNAHHRTSVRKWRETMYRACLENPGLMDRLLARFGTVGCFRSHAPLPSSHSRTIGEVPWHWSGTFFWLDHERLVGKEGWGRLDRGLGRWAAEGYPGRVFSEAEGFELIGFGDLGMHSANLYGTTSREWARVEAALAAIPIKVERVLREPEGDEVGDEK